MQNIQVQKYALYKWTVILYVMDSWYVMWYVSSSKLSSKFRTPCTCSPVAAPRPWTAVSSARKSSVQRGYDMSMSLNRCLLDIKQLNARPVKETGDLPRWSCHTSSNKKFNWNIQPSTGPSQTSLWFQTHLKNIIQSSWIISPRFGVKIKNIWNHHFPLSAASRFQSLSASTQHRSRDWHPSGDFQQFASFQRDQQDDRYTTWVILAN